ncbi:MULTISPECIES: hypothetical protein [unclassified Streptomyces]|uniref:hypothetical protein n=1 Tax=unclassified Streptomyces TaxID=2593676 RepID=UPI001CB6D802|nr:MULTISPECIES: hypothetical protein [unclassified Streptomyces]MBD0711144.1 hypothetical protein [Streptomyces sp. CBMA291]MBD0714175.1 hypothetical protein [Streptomyces sp. CBMA370]
MSSVRVVTMGLPMGPPAGLPAEPLDVYDLSEELLLSGGIKGLSLVNTVDQIFLERQAPLLERFVRGGGRILVNGHVVRPFLPGLSPWRALDYHGPDDLRISPVTPHPVFEGVDYLELLYRTGVPGTPTGDDLARLGVAGFYGRGYHSRVPEGGTVLNGIGPHALPIDVLYPLGEGFVMAHAGNDLSLFSDPDRSTRSLGPRLHAWLEGTL